MSAFLVEDHVHGFSLGFRDQHLEIGVGRADTFFHGRPAREDDGLAIQFGRVGDEGVLFPGDEHVGVREQRFGEQQPFVARGRLVQEAERQALPLA